MKAGHEKSGMVHRSYFLFIYGKYRDATHRHLDSLVT